MTTAQRNEMHARGDVFDAKWELERVLINYSDADKNHPTKVTARKNLANAIDKLRQIREKNAADTKFESGYNGVFAASLKAAIR